MSREILFRAWNKEKKIMCYDNEDNSATYWDGVFSSNVELINTYLNLPETMQNYEYMQWTGLTDKNGTKIFEGDIVKIGLEHHYEVWWNCDNCSFTLSSDEESRELYIYNDETIEVIGNIYDNPELLEMEE